MGFGFLKADVANELYLGDLESCGYLVLLNGGKSAGACYELVGGEFF